MIFIINLLQDEIKPLQHLQFRRDTNQTMYLLLINKAQAVLGRTQAWSGVRSAQCSRPSKPSALSCDQEKSQKEVKQQVGFCWFSFLFFLHLEEEEVTRLERRKS